MVSTSQLSWDQLGHELGFRGRQQDIIANVVAGRDTMTTAHGGW